MNLGLEHGKNRLVAYSSDWPRLFEQESAKILQACGEHILAIEHVGSTSIPDLVAKPIIDIAVGVNTLDDTEKMIEGMQSIGYDYPGDIGIPDDRIFGRDKPIRFFLVHVVKYRGARWNRYTFFRDALRKDNSLASEYAELKIKIANKHPEGRATYTDLKSEFINTVLQQLIR